MAGKKHFKQVESALERHGYEFSHRNSKAMYVFMRGREELVVNPSCAESAARQIIRRLQRDNGTAEAAPKRDAVAIKERHAAERERLKAEAARLDRERADIIAMKDAYFSGAGSMLTAAEVKALEARVREIERESREIQRLMSAPVTGAHAGNGRVTHEAGSR